MSDATALGPPVFPVSVETEDLQARASTQRVSELKAKYKTEGFLFLGVDRLDYIKAIDKLDRDEPGDEAKFAQAHSLSNK